MERPYRDIEANFVISEIGIFNPGEWTKTRQLLPGITSDTNDCGTWNVVNPTYDPAYMPRYYAFNEDGTIPLIVNGTIVAPDVGLLVPRDRHAGLTLNYDRRLKNSLDLQMSNQISRTPELWTSVAATNS